MTWCLPVTSHHLNQSCLWRYMASLSHHVLTLDFLNVSDEKKCTHIYIFLTHWSVSKLTIIGSDNGLSPGRHQAIIWANAGILLIRPLGANFSEILFEILTLSFKKMQFKVSSAKWRPFCLGLNGSMSLYWNSLRNTMTRSSHAVNTMAVDVLATQGPSALATIILN